jgi:hypothetical protein
MIPTLVVNVSAADISKSVPEEEIEQTGYDVYVTVHNST